MEAYPLFGLDTRDYDDLFAEKLDLFLKLSETTNITREGRWPSKGKVFFRVPINRSYHYGSGSAARRNPSLVPVRLAFR